MTLKGKWGGGKKTSDLYCNPGHSCQSEAAPSMYKAEVEVKRK